MLKSTYTTFSSSNTKTILVLGGHGLFGSQIVSLLTHSLLESSSSTTTTTIVVGGRNAKKCEGVASYFNSLCSSSKKNDKNVKVVSRGNLDVTNVEDYRNILLNELQPDIVINATHQCRTPIVNATLLASSHYIDISNSTQLIREIEFGVSDFVKSLTFLNRKKHRHPCRSLLAATGVSTSPTITSFMLNDILSSSHPDHRDLLLDIKDLTVSLRPGMKISSSKFSYLPQDAGAETMKSGCLFQIGRINFLRWRNERLVKFSDLENDSKLELKPSKSLLLWAEDPMDNSDKIWEKSFRGYSKRKVFYPFSSKSYKDGFASLKKREEIASFSTAASPDCLIGRDFFHLVENHSDSNNRKHKARIQNVHFQVSLEIDFLHRFLVQRYPENLARSRGGAAKKFWDSPRGTFLLTRCSNFLTSTFGREIGFCEVKIDNNHDPSATASSSFSSSCSSSSSGIGRRLWAKNGQGSFLPAAPSVALALNLLKNKNDFDKDDRNEEEKVYVWNGIVPYQKRHFPESNHPAVSSLSLEQILDVASSSARATNEDEEQEEKKESPFYIERF